MMMMSSASVSPSRTSSSPSSSTIKRQQHHVFLFRHCVRSLPDAIDFYEDVNDDDITGGSDGTTTRNPRQRMDRGGSNYSTNPHDYLPHWPQWNTPPQWCTAVGSDIMKGTGRFLFHRYLRAINDYDYDNGNSNTTANNNNNNSNNVDGGRGIMNTSTTTTTQHRRRRRRVKFLSDNTPRDVQTTLAIMTGISEEEEKELQLLQLNRQTTQTQSITTTTRQYYEDPPSNRLQGLHHIQLDPELFNHLDEQQQQHDEDICVLPPKVDTIRAIAERLRTIPPPGTLVEIMEWMERTTGHMGLFRPFFNDDDSQDDRNQIQLTPSGEHFQGALNLVKYISQAITYSRASGIFVDEWTNNNHTITTAEYYNLMAWEHWSRHILDVGHNLAAARGGIMMARILNELSIHARNAEDDDDDDDHDDCIGNDDDEEDEDGVEEDIRVTFIIGHDGDIDAVATALGIDWNLPSPYHSGFTSTPPGSAIHFAYDVDQGQLAISVMAPIFFSNGNASGGERVEGLNSLNSSGILEEVPVKFMNHVRVKRGGGTPIVDAAVFSSLDDLRKHTLNTLRGYNGSAECFEAAENLATGPNLLLLPHHQPDHTGSTILLLGLLLGFAMLANLLQCVHRERYPKSTKQHRGSYAGMSLPNDLDFS